MIKHYAIRFVENEKRDNIELNLLVQTSNVLLARKPISRLRKIIMWNDTFVELALANQLD